MIEFAIGLVLGLLIGLAAGIVLLVLRKRTAQRDIEVLQQQMREAFASLAASALDANAKRLGDSAAAQLDGKKALIDQAIKNVNDRLNQLGTYFQNIEKERKSEFGQLSSSVQSLSQTAGELHKVLASTQRRGAWGERMADDILSLAGLCETVHFHKQDTRFASGDRERPDFTFLLPNETVVNMDVKFPLENFRRYLDADEESTREAAAAQLLRDIRSHIKGVASRGYITEQTVPYVLLFIPSEQIYSLALERQPDLIDEALGQKIVLTSPMTLYAMLALIRQAAENTEIMRAADEVIALLQQFDDQWQRYREEVDRLGNQLQTVQKTYDGLVSTRTNQLEKPLAKIDDLRQQRALGELDA
jgi:DNA recombination protein RmuC